MTDRGSEKLLTITLWISLVLHLGLLFALPAPGRAESPAPIALEVEWLPAAEPVAPPPEIAAAPEPPLPETLPPETLPPEPPPPEPIPEPEPISEPEPAPAASGRYAHQ